MIDIRQAGFIPGGFVDNWLRYCEPFEFPESYAVFALLGIAAAAVDGRITINPGSEPSVQANQYILLYGPSGSRKGTAIRHAMYLLSEAFEDAPILPRSFTMEVLKVRLAEKSARTQKGNGLIVADEFSDLIGGAKYKEGNTRFLTDIWDCPAVYPHDTVTHGYLEIIHPYICGLWSSSPDWLEQVDPKLLTGGFLRRTLIVVEYGPKSRNPEPHRDRVIFEGLARVFKERFAPSAIYDNTSMVLTPAAREAKAAWYDSLIAYGQKGEKEGHFASCMEAHALKMACSLHILEGGDPMALSAANLVIAQRLLEAIVEPMFQAYAALAPTPFARLQATILRILKTGGGKMNEFKLVKSVRAATGVKPSEYAVAAESLVNERVLAREDGGIRVRSMAEQAGD